jgi:hypothetical protein
VRGRAADRQPDGAHAGRRSPHKAPPARDVLCRPSVAGLGIHAQLLVKKGQLLVKLAPCLHEFIESRPPLGVGDAVVRSRLRFEAARSGDHKNVALPRGIVPSRGPCPLSRRRPRGGTGRVEVVDVGCHRVVREDGLSTGVHHGVTLHELPPRPAAHLCVGLGPNMLMMMSSEKPRTKASRLAAPVRILG